MHIVDMWQSKSYDNHLKEIGPKMAIPLKGSLSMGFLRRDDDSLSLELCYSLNIDWSPVHYKNIPSLDKKTENLYGKPSLTCVNSSFLFYMTNNSNTYTADICFWEERNKMQSLPCITSLYMYLSFRSKVQMTDYSLRYLASLQSGGFSLALSVSTRRKTISSVDTFDSKESRYQGDLKPLCIFRGTDALWLSMFPFYSLLPYPNESNPHLCWNKRSSWNRLRSISPCFSEVLFS